jgi:hypothetical protein
LDRLSGRNQETLWSKIMLGMSEYQLELLLEYIDLSAMPEKYRHNIARIAEIRELLLEDANANKERLNKISESLSNLKVI